MFLPIHRVEGGLANLVKLGPGLRLEIVSVRAIAEH
jgi:hypothetical protein